MPFSKANVRVRGRQPSTRSPSAEHSSLQPTASLLEPLRAWTQPILLEEQTILFEEHMFRRLRLVRQLHQLRGFRHQSGEHSAFSSSEVCLVSKAQSRV